MNIKISNKKLLDSNFYNKIVLVQEDDLVKVNVSGKIPFKTEKSTSQSFSDSIKYKDSNDQIIDIINYFLNYDKINQIVPNNLLGYYDGRFETIHSEDRVLAFQLNKNDKLQQLPNMIYNKYSNDRRLFIENNKDCKNILITSGYYSRYERINDTIIGERIIIHIIDNKYTNIEYKALDDLLKNIIEEKNEKISYVWNKKYSYPTLKKDYGGIIKCGDLTINVNTDIPYKYVNNCIEEYNKNFEENKKLQLKMEGF